METHVSTRLRTFLRFSAALALGILIPRLAATTCLAAEPAAQAHHRLVVLSDIEADPDDTQSFVRLFLYANSIDIEALIATTSVHQKTRVAPESIRKLIEAYGKVRANLLQHEPGFPEAQVVARSRHAGLAGVWPEGRG